LNTGAGDISPQRNGRKKAIRARKPASAGIRGKSPAPGRPGEIDRNQRIASAAQYPLINTGNDNPMRKFAGLLEIAAL